MATPDPTQNVNVEILKNPLIKARSFLSRALGGELPPLSEGAYPWDKVELHGQPILLFANSGTSAIAAKTFTKISLATSESLGKIFTEDSAGLVKANSSDLRLFLNGIRAFVVATTDTTMANVKSLIEGLAAVDLVIKDFESRNSQASELAVNLLTLAEMGEAAGIVATGKDDGTADVRNVGLFDTGLARDFRLPEALHMGRQFAVGFRTGASAWTPTANVSIYVALDVTAVKVGEKDSVPLRGAWRDNCHEGVVPEQRIRELTAMPLPVRVISRKR